MSADGISNGFHPPTGKSLQVLLVAFALLSTMMLIA